MVEKLSNNESLEIVKKIVKIIIINKGKKIIK